MFTVLRSKEFDTWLDALKDRTGKARILARLISAGLGNFGDAEPVGGGISELRIHVGPGYRVYYTRKKKTLVFVLCGGDKSSQKKDIAKAKLIATSIKVE